MRYFASAALAALGLMAFTATSASAAIVCNDEGDCWHAKKKYDYHPEFHVQAHPDDWPWAEADNGSTIGASMKVRVIGAAASGSGSKRRSLEWNFCVVRSLSESFGKDARPSPEPIARSGKRKRKPGIPSGFFLGSLCGPAGAAEHELWQPPSGRIE